MKKILIIIIIFFESFVYADTCTDHSDITIKTTNSVVKIVATGVATVNSNDSEGVIDAMVNAKLYAKSLISRFLGETISLDKSINTILRTKVKRENGKVVDVSQDESQVFLKSISSNSNHLLYDLVELSDCYSESEKIVTFTIGIKSNLIK
jgi:hypothetical protein